MTLRERLWPMCWKDSNWKDSKQRKGGAANENRNAAFGPRGGGNSLPNLQAAVSLASTLLESNENHEDSKIKIRAKDYESTY